jgi:hypothetical protein
VHQVALCGLDERSSARRDTEFSASVLQVKLNCAFAQAENLCDLRECLAAGCPFECLDLALPQADVLRPDCTGITPPNGNTGAPASQACMDSTVASGGACASGAGLWVPDLRRSEILWGAGVMVKF